MILLRTVSAQIIRHLCMAKIGEWVIVLFTLRGGGQWPHLRRMTKSLLSREKWDAMAKGFIDEWSIK